MSRQTPFPGIIIEEIEASVGGGGKILEFEEGLPEDIPSRRIQSFFETINLFGTDLAETEVVYRLQVTAYAKAAAHGKARTFVRAKNPFSPRLLEVRNVRKKKDLGILRGGRNAYSVEVKVIK